ncbi:PLP-dependent transferase [Lentinus brumalis]|uniref:PLP-dependent transferase n=1 Tax=Lentinus brumalis TaxID=2498619 RepID=A0A371DML7_9APHY|nr:PLP-dependent transferase [Polyporus brumalis]
MSQYLTEKVQEKRKAIDLSHHLSDLSRARATSPLKGLARYFGRPDLISLAGGMPNEAYFPFAAISGDALVPDSFSLASNQSESSLSWFWKLFGSRKEKTTSISIPKYPATKDDITLKVALQYGTATGLPQLQKFINELVEKIYQPAYSDWTTLVQTGNTDGWGRAVTTLCNPGEAFITEDWTYPSALAGSAPHGIHPVGVLMDDQGMRSEELRKLLAEWDESVRGCKRPHVMYTVPVGQNPTGVTMGLDRKKEIYDICVEYDVIIVEDDPYYFLQMGSYGAKLDRASQAMHADPESWLSSLAPSYVKYVIDYQGRVIRLDTFSKTIAPGSRLGFYTCNPRFAERLERAGEVSTQAPCGFGQSLIAQLLTTWKYEGYVRWLQGLAVQYKSRRDFLLDALREEFHMQVSVGTTSSWKGCTVYTASAKPKTGSSRMLEKRAYGSKALFSLVPPTSGMFVWLKLHFENVPGFQPDEEPNTMEMKLWVKLAEAGVLIGPGRYFASDQEDASPVDGHFRIAFSYASEEDFTKAVKIFGEVLREFFQEQ